MHLLEEISLQRTLFWGLIKITGLLILAYIWYRNIAKSRKMIEESGTVTSSWVFKAVGTLLASLLFIWFCSIELSYRKTEVLPNTLNINRSEIIEVQPDKEKSLLEKSKEMIEESRNSNKKSREKFEELP